jgi:hypothetical protein
VRNLIRGAQFKPDVKLAERRGKDLTKLRELILLLVESGPCRRAIRTTLSAGIGNIIGIATWNRIGSCFTTLMGTTCTWSAREHIRTCSSSWRTPAAS